MSSNALIHVQGKLKCNGDTVNLTYANGLVSARPDYALKLFGDTAKIYRDNNIPYEIAGGHHFTGDAMKNPVGFIMLCSELLQAGYQTSGTDVSAIIHKDIPPDAIH